MTGIIEWTHDALCVFERPEYRPLEAPRWDDDHLHAIRFETDKEYDFFAAIAGVRNRFDRAPLFPRRGKPKATSGMAAEVLNHCYDDECGWLHLSEIDAAIVHMAGDDRVWLGTEVEIALETMRNIVRRMTDPHVRMIFYIH